MMELAIWVVLSALAILVIYQQIRMYQLHQEARKREELFQIVTENAADMIALVDVKGRRLYNSPAYKRILGYSPAELGETSAFEQIHPDDRFRVLEAAREARQSGIGQRLEYRIRHKNGTWRVLESSASTIRDAKGEVAKLVIVNRDVTDRKRAEEQLEHNLFHDALTGLPNRRLFLDRLGHAFARSQRDAQRRYALMLIDLDRFKSVNQMMGTAAGDEVIRAVGQRIEDCLRGDDTVARPQDTHSQLDRAVSRLGGDEFVILLENVSHPSDALRAAQRTQGAISDPVFVNGREARTSASIGIALSSPTYVRAEDLLQDAEAALRRAKALGGSRCEVFDESMHTQAANRLKLEADLRAAIGKRQFRVFYQPIVKLATREVQGLEALLRWQHPLQGLISPDKFLEAAEDSGLLIAIGHWLVSEACKQQVAWLTANAACVPAGVTVNLSARQFAAPDLVETLRRTIQESGIEPAQLRLEISEDVLAGDLKAGFNILAQLRQLGVSTILDNFGIGNCSLSQMRRMPVSGVKIDRSLVREMLGDRGTYDIVELIITVAHKLNLQVIAEGIESAAQLDRLQGLGCDFGQGYFFSKPVEAAVVQGLLRQQPRRAFARGAPARD
jgi:diguanylate cyclase (GGDEF)-like protein/PAS domain S-box-containing protein